MASISASMATLAFNNAFDENVGDFYSKNITDDWTSDWVDVLFNKYRERIGTALFDSRIYNIPKEEVCNALIWRQQDATRNAIQMVGQANFSHKQLQNKNCNQIQEMLFQEKQINFNDLPTYQKRGTCIVKETYTKEDTQRTRWVEDKDIPIFTQDRNYIEKYL
jgi:tRNA(His) 5'-end guanylyltransferase